MPIFEYKCAECGEQFEVIVMGSREAECPSCKSKKLEQQMSTFAARTQSSAPSTMPCGAPGGSCGGGGCKFN